MTTITPSEYQAIVHWLLYIMLPLIGVFFFCVTGKDFPGRRRKSYALHGEHENITEIIGIITSKN